MDLPAGQCFHTARCAVMCVEEAGLNSGPGRGGLRRSSLGLSGRWPPKDPGRSSRWSSLEPHPPVPRGGSGICAEAQGSSPGAT
eukprot:4302508-Pyramimonas_sp.AAC.1